MTTLVQLAACQCRTLITLACPRPGCTSKPVQVLPGGSANCNAHPRPQAMTPINPLPLGDTQ